MRRIANENDVVIINEAAEFSPAYARLCTPSISTSATHTTDTHFNGRSNNDVIATPRVIFASNDGEDRDENDDSIMNQSRLIEA